MEASFAPHSNLPFGDCDYSTHAPMSYSVFEEAKPSFMQALDNIAFDPAAKKPFTIADYGTADAGSSMPLISSLISEIKNKHGTEQEIQVFYEDQPVANFNALFGRLHGLREGKTVSYLKQYGNVFVSACGTNFYSQCFPKESINLGFCFTAIQWLSHRPCVLKTSLQHLYSEDDTERKTFSEAARKDYELFLIQRAQELKYGGYLLLGSLTNDQNGVFATKTSRIKQTYVELEKEWKNMLHDDVITQDEFESTTFNSYYRTKDELVAPFQNQESSIYRSGLRLQSVQSIFVPCVHNQAWMKSLEKDDIKKRQQHADSFVQRQRAWSNTSLMSGLSNERTEEDKTRVVDEFFSRYANRIVEAPEQHGQDFIQTVLVIKKDHA